MGAVRSHLSRRQPLPALGVGQASRATHRYRQTEQSVRGLGQRIFFLHDGRARSVDEVLREWHKPEELNGAALTDDEREALIAYLKSL